MGAPGTEGREPADPLTEERNPKIPPYRMGCLIETASAMAKVMTAGKYLSFPTYEECGIILDILRDTLEQAKEVT